MVWLVVGVLLWSAVHLSPSVAPGARAAAVAAVGEHPYKGGFALLVLASITSMAIGWRAHEPAPLYAPPAGAGAASVAMFAALFLFAAAALGSNVKRVLRHPQLTGFALWAAAHLLANGDDRSLVLFGGLGLWALVQMPLLSRRDGEWRRPEPLPAKAELGPLAAASAAFAILFAAHSWFAGAPLA